MVLSAGFEVLTVFSCRRSHTTLAFSSAACALTRSSSPCGFGQSLVATSRHAKVVYGSFCRSAYGCFHRLFLSLIDLRSTPTVRQEHSPSFFSTGIAD